MTLSDNDHKARCECKLCGRRLEIVYREDDVKDFIMKVIFITASNKSTAWKIKEINKEAGDKLIDTHSAGCAN